MNISAWSPQIKAISENKDIQTQHGGKKTVTTFNLNRG
jgi:hypothetical protein